MALKTETLDLALEKMLCEEEPWLGVAKMVDERLCRDGMASARRQSILRRHVMKSTARARLLLEGCLQTLLEMGYEKATVAAKGGRLSILAEGPGDPLHVVVPVFRSGGPFRYGVQESEEGPVLTIMPEKHEVAGGRENGLA